MSKLEFVKHYSDRFTQIGRFEMLKEVYEEHEKQLTEKDNLIKELVAGLKHASIILGAEAYPTTKNKIDALISKATKQP